MFIIQGHSDKHNRCFVSPCGVLPTIACMSHCAPTHLLCSEMDTDSSVRLERDLPYFTFG